MWNAALGSLLLMSAGCGADASAPSSARAPAGDRASVGFESSDAPDEVCPADLPELEARSTEIRGGGALVLTTNHEHVYELRHRMRRFAQEHRDAAAERARLALARSGTADETGGVMDTSMVQVVEVPHGARVEVRPRHLGDLDAVRNEVRAQAQDLAEGRCPITFTTHR